MDWLDQYLHELNRPGTVVHLPPDKPSWNRLNPTKQQLSLIQDATIADMVRMRNIQEARQAEIDAGAGGGYDAGSAPLASAPAPAGIPVAGTSSIIVNGETYTGGGTVYGIGRESVSDEVLGCTNDCGMNSVQDSIVYRNGSWKFEVNWLNGSFFEGYSYVSSTNPSTNSSFIPTAGWSPALTITAA